MDNEIPEKNTFPIVANSILLFEYFLLLVFLFHMYFKQQRVLKKPSGLILYFYILLISSTLIRILLFLDVGIDYTLSAYTIILFLAVLPYFSAASIMIYIWYSLLRADIYMLTRWDIEISKRFLLISQFKLLAISLNLAFWILFFLLAICSALELYHIEGLNRGVNILEAVLSFIIMLAILLAVGSLGRRVRMMVNHMPGRLIPWMGFSLIATTYRFISQLLVLFSKNLWGIIDKSSLW